MSCKNTLKSLLKKFDMFSQQVTFRYNDEPSYESLTGGCISLLLIFVFVGIFATTLLRIVEKEYIHFNQSRHDEQTPGYFATTLDKTFMFAIGLDGIDATHGERYFDIYMQFRDYNSTHKLKTNMPLQICERGPWQQRGYGAAFDSLNLTRWYCPTQDQRLELQGKFTSQSFKFYKIAVTKCNATLEPTRPCASDATIQAYLNANQAFNFNYYFINTIINPGDDVYLRTYLDDVNYFPFSKTNGVNANLFISSYTIQTDESLWPVEDFQEDQGGIVLDPAQVMNYQVRGKQYLKLYLRKSPISIAISRSFRKVDDTLSYIGGLFSTIIGFLGIVSMYNQLAYEIQISRSSYYYDKNDPFDGDHFNMLTFIPYLLYLFLDIFGIELKWPKLQRLHRYLEQGRKHLDIKLIIKKILYAQKLGLAVLDKTKHKALLLSEPFTLDQADVIRKDLSFYKQCRKKFFPNGQLDSQQLTKFGSKKELMSSAVFNDDGVGFSKVYPMPDESIMRQNTDILRQNTFDQKMESNQEMNKQATKSDQDIKIQDEEEFSQLEKQVKLSLMELQAEVQKNDPIAKRIWQNIDPRIKKRYLTSSDIPRKLRMSMKLDSSSLKNL